MKTTNNSAADRQISHHTRRWFLQDCRAGVGRIALASLLANGLSKTSSAADSQSPTAPRDPHFTPKVKRVIYLFMAGAPSQLELFDLSLIHI